MVEAGTVVSAAREEILQRVVAAIGEPAAETAATHAYRRAGTLSREQLVDLFCRRVGEYRAEVHRIDTAGLRRNDRVRLRYPNDRRPARHSAGVATGERCR